MYVTYSMKQVEENRRYYEMMYDASFHLVKVDQIMD
ncbi:hypothetical protein SAMN04488574_11020 [Bacillus sp. 71mf]|nr:hypothetical protein SAMN04488574_11020 [Bacillus sp. 71mf]SFT02263.1 hypothetical protein SAMN04488145_107116 [Bacillus sp. 103mf]